MNKSNDDFTENHANQFMIPLAPHARVRFIWSINCSTPENNFDYTYSKYSYNYTHIQYCLFAHKPMCMYVYSIHKIT